MSEERTTLTSSDIARQVFESEIQAIQVAKCYLDEHFEKAVELLLECDSHVVVSGLGKSGLVGQKISATLASTGTPSHFLHPTEAVHGDLGRIRRGDVVILLSYSGRTEEVASLAAILRQDGIAIISISRDRSTRLAALSDAALSTGDIEEACEHGLAPTSTTTAMMAIGDALAIAASRQRNFFSRGLQQVASWRNAWQNHDAGRRNAAVQSWQKYRGRQRKRNRPGSIEPGGSVPASLWCDTDIQN